MIRGVCDDDLTLGADRAAGRYGTSGPDGSLATEPRKPIAQTFRFWPRRPIVSASVTSPETSA